MIVTHEQDKIVDHGFMLIPKTQLWRRAHLELAIPYFFLTYDIAQGPGWICQTELYWEIDQLLHSCAQVADDESLRLTQIALISPSWMNGQNGWQMDSIREIWRSRNEGASHPVTHYVTSTGKRLIDPPGETNTIPLIKLLAIEGDSLYVSQQP